MWQLPTIRDCDFRGKSVPLQSKKGRKRYEKDETIRG